MTDAIAPASIVTPDQEARAIRIGDVLDQARIAFVAHWAIYSGIAMIVYAAMLAVKAPSAWTISSDHVIPIRHYWASLLDLLLDSAMQSLADAVICVSVSQELGGRPFSLSQALGVALRRSPALIAVDLLTTICATLAALLLIVPGLIVGSVYAVALPACVIERIGPIKAMSRSTFLTKGNRWRIVGFNLFVYLGLPMPSLIIAYMGRTDRTHDFFLSSRRPCRRDRQRFRRGHDGRSLRAIASRQGWRRCRACRGSVRLVRVASCRNHPPSLRGSEATKR